MYKNKKIKMDGLNKKPKIEERKRNKMTVFNINNPTPWSTPKSIPLPVDFLSDIKYCRELDNKQLNYIEIIKDNWRGEIERFRSYINKDGTLKFPIKKYKWVMELKPLEFIPNIIRDICFLLQQGINPAEPEILEWKHSHLIGDYLGMPLYAGMLPIIKEKFIKSLEYIHRKIDPSNIPFEILEEESENNSIKISDGGNNYKFIVNPETNRRVTINGKKGAKILQKYLTQSIKQ